MRIFKNRGDIFFSKTNKEKSTEQKILLIALAVIVVFSVIFMFVVGAKNDFSAKKFFVPDDLSTTSAEATDTTVALPQVSGKTNYIITVSDNSDLLFVELLQVDLDNVSYKVCTLKSTTEYDGSTLGYIYTHSGAQNVKTAVESMMSVKFDYYLDFERDKFCEYFDELGSVNYAFAKDIRYKNNKATTPYTVRIKSGDQTLKGTQVVNLVRYYLESGNNQSSANDILLNSLSKQINSTNYEKKDQLFQDLVTKSTTNITVRDYSSADDLITVLCNNQNGVSLYGAPIKYKKNKITKETLQSAKDYFVK